MAKKSKSKAPTSLYHPQYWPTWLTIGLMNLWARLPWKLQWIIAKGLSTLLFHFASHRRHIVEVNLRMCFPEWSLKEQRQQTKDVLFNNLYGLVETAVAYRKPPKAWHYDIKIHGLELLQKAKEEARGVLLIGAHYSHLDLGGAILGQVCEPCAIYRPNNNPVFDQYILSGRQRFLDSVIPRDNMRAIIKALKQQKIVWYPPDQDYGRKHSVYAPFFGVNAATITATSRLAGFNQSPVLIMSCYRDDSERCYHLGLHPSPKGFPSGDDTADAALINKALEDCIRRSPTQYMWTHRRFKSQPDGKAKLYKR